LVPHTDPVQGFGLSDNCPREGAEWAQREKVGGKGKGEGEILRGWEEEGQAGRGKETRGGGKREEREGGRRRGKGEEEREGGGGEGKGEDLLLGLNKTGQRSG